ncbi:cation/calcium exchanger 1-like [Malania oleifera]|uniref:cation/calcium exchanger 1-like n=1 Tax=Malania oleifera TaxID=397392 RepID=UPI0025ADC72A|nr:cation/calcium exchanger 1-like [Malania oleifera]
MASLFRSQGQYLPLFLNISFLFLLSFCLTAHLHTPNSNFLTHHYRGPKSNTIVTPASISDTDSGCQGLHKHHNNKAKCAYIRSHSGCQSTGYISYLQVFYCSCGPILGYTISILWLILLFYLLGNTAAVYFCSSLEGMSRVLKLSPALAGVTLLSLGNGAPDLFSSIVSFMGNDTEEVGLNSILGGAFFVSTIVVGIISICVDHRQVSVDKSSFRRDVLFFLFSLSCLLVIIILGKINLWGAIGFLSLYFIYVFMASASDLCSNQSRGSTGDIVLPISKNLNGHDHEAQTSLTLEAPLLGYAQDGKLILVESGNLRVGEGKPRTWCFNPESSTGYFLRKCLFLLELPLYLPRRLTIPVVSDEEWSKPFAVMSVTLGPLLLAVLSNSYFPKSSMLIYAIGSSVGVILGVLAFLTTESPNPPRRWLFPWLAAGFLMSITWTYILAEELISLLVSLGLISGISPSILGLTVLAWGNSLGDLVSNITMAKTGGSEGTQVAISGCYAGPLFNTLVGLGLSLVFSTWSVYPSSYAIPRDPYIYVTMGFLMGGLLFAFIILPKKNMRLDRFLGLGLLAIYLCFLSLRITRAASGMLSFPESPTFFRH